LSASDSLTVDHAGSVLSGSPQLDALLGDGLDRGSSALLVGPPIFQKPSGYEAFLRIGEIIHELLPRTPADTNIL